MYGWVRLNSLVRKILTKNRISGPDLEQIPKTALPTTHGTEVCKIKETRRRITLLALLCWKCSTSHLGDRAIFGIFSRLGVLPVQASQGGPNHAHETSGKIRWQPGEIRIDVSMVACLAWGAVHPERRSGLPAAGPEQSNTIHMTRRAFSSKAMLEE